MASSNTSMADAIDQVKQNQKTFVTCWSVFLFSFGVIGHSLSLYVFTRRVLFRNPCTFYFLALTISGCVVAFATVPLRLLQLVYNIDLFSTSEPMCRILSYIFGVARIYPSWFVVLAAVDRFLCSSSSATLRSWSNVRIASRAIILVVLIISLLYVHILINFGIQLPQKTCLTVSSAYQAFLSVYNIIIWSWLPTAGMLIFGLLTIRNIRQGRRRVAPHTTEDPSQRNRKKTDMQLINMVLVQSFVFGSTTTAQASISFYIGLGTRPTDSALKKLHDFYLMNIFSYIALSGSCLSFYLFTLSSQLFRRELMKLFQWRPWVPNRNNTITMTQRT